ncbi:MAG: thiolase domain-containing protein [Candidatus Thermoplasmatota archaeon]|nr:thiolase domain-containing protein [Candidatus Thermoplasmatota archaeon]
MNVYVAGTGMTKFGKHAESSIELSVEAAAKAMEDAGIAPEEIEELYVGNFAQNMFEGQAHPGPALYGSLGLKNNIKATHVESACASGGFALHEAFRAIKGGFAKTVMVVGVEKMTSRPTPEVTGILATAGDAFYEVPCGITFPGYFALMASYYLKNIGGTRDDLAEIAIKNHHHASKNPYAQFRKEITKDVYYGSPIIAEPLCLYDCSPISDGAAAMILTSEKKDVELASCEAAVSRMALAERREDISWLESAEIAGKRAYMVAGVTPEDIDVAEVHDCFTIAEVQNIEALGFYKHGEGIKAAKEKETYYDGKKPVNTDGGLKAKGHPVGATGVSMAIEVVKQIHNEAYNQVKGAEVGLISNMGGSGPSCVAGILRRS